MTPVRPLLKSLAASFLALVAACGGVDPEPAADAEPAPDAEPAAEATEEPAAPPTENEESQDQ